MPTTELLQISLDSKLFLPNIKFIGGLSPARRLDALMRYDQSGLEALIFAAEGDMRNALNGSQLGRPGSFQRSKSNNQTNHLAKKVYGIFMLRSTFNAFGEINRNTVFRTKSCCCCCCCDPNPQNPLDPFGLALKVQ